MKKEMKLKVLDKDGKQVEEIAVLCEVFGAERNEILIHEVAVAQQNNMRQGTKSTLTMSEVRGHHKKPYRQKGTGNARQGTTKGPQFRGGGVVFAPKPRDFSTKINKVKKTNAFLSAISGKVADNELLVIKDLKFKEAKTKFAAEMIGKLKIDGKSIIFVNPYEQGFIRSVQNIKRVKSTTPEQLSVHDIVNHRYVVASVEAIRVIEGQYSAGEVKVEKTDGKRAKGDKVSVNGAKSREVTK
ncbi:MAG: 50S ribosomal protein L4 [Christensenellaceae bacterium]|jgi:large subunit ribosomal protein L4|nr:50S ribosomal protein L4 [Christensenellaceae bacterium]